MVQVGTKLLGVGIAGAPVLADLIPAGVDIGDFVLEEKVVAQASHNLFNFSV